MAGFLGFLLAGGFAAILNMASRLLLSAFMPFEVAVALAYLIGMTAAFLLMRRFVFDASEMDPGAQFGRFAVVNLVAFCAVWLVSVSLARIAFPAVGFTWHAETIAHMFGVLSPAVLSFWGHKAFTFRRPAA
jgi:putative flippase GtrA